MKLIWMKDKIYLRHIKKMEVKRKKILQGILDIVV